MGKRKYDSESKDTAKKSKSDDNSENSVHESISEEPKKDEKRTQNTSKPKLFDIKHFRKELARKQGQTMELADVEPSEIVQDFCSTLRSIVQKNPESRDKCELVHYDDLDPSQNLADILLDKIRELEPDFENIIARRE